MGPSSSARCRACGYRVGKEVVGALFAVLLIWAPLIVLALLSAFVTVESLLAGILVCLICLCAGVIINTFCVRLMLNELTTPEMVAEALQKKQEKAD